MLNRTTKELVLYYVIYMTVLNHTTPVKFYKIRTQIDEVLFFFHQYPL